MATAQILNCIVWDEPVRPRQQGIQCDGCFRWNHRICNTGISQEVYRAAVRDGTEIDWQCAVCTHADSVGSVADPSSYMEAPNLTFADSVADPSSYMELEAPNVTFADHAEPQPDAESTRIEDPDESQADNDAANQYTDHEESSLLDPAPAETSSSFALTYEIVESSSKKGRPKLIDSHGFTFTLHRRRGVVTDWQCSVRPKSNPCRATVRQRGDQFLSGNHLHNHQAKVGALTAAKISVQVKAKAVEDIFKPAPAIIDEVTLQLYNLR
ncbi:hypothetical protein ACROYT_G041939 [Oculina patagonica]